MVKEYRLRLTDAEYNVLINKIEDGHIEGNDALHLENVRLKLRKVLPVTTPIG